MQQESLKQNELMDTQALSPIVVTLLKRVVYKENDPVLWNALMNMQTRVRDYIVVLGLELILDEAEGYAFLRSRTGQEDEEAPSVMPRLIMRRPLSFSVSLLLALLRKKLAEFDASGTDTRLILSKNDIVQLLRVFLPEGSNEAKWMDQIETHMNKIAELGFVRRLKPSSGGQESLFEVLRIVKAFVDAQWLSDFDQRLAAYQAQLASQQEGTLND